MLRQCIQYAYHTVMHPKLFGGDQIVLTIQRGPYSPTKLGFCK